MRKNANIQIFRKDSHCVLFDIKTKKSFNVGEEEFKLWNSLDGRELCKIDSVFSEEEKIKLIKIFEEVGLLESTARKIKRSGKYKKALVCPDAFLERHNLLLSIYGYLLFGGMMAMVPVIFLCDFIDIKSIIIRNMNVETGLLGIIFVIISLSFHELSHAVIAKKNGAVVPEIGVMLNFILPCAYTTVCDTQNIPTIGKKIQVALAGIGGNILLTTIGVYTYLLCESESAKFLCIEFVFANIIPIIGNINIFYRDDSYVIIESLLGISNLKKTAKEFLRDIFKYRKFREYEEADSMKNIVLLLYAIGAYVNEILFPFILIFLLVSTYM